MYLGGGQSWKHSKFHNIAFVVAWAYQSGCVPARFNDQGGLELNRDNDWPVVILMLVLKSFVPTQPPRRQHGFKYHKDNQALCA